MAKVSKAMSKRLQEIDDRVDLPLGQNAVAAERWHHRQRIALCFVGHDRDQLLAIVLAVELLELRSDRARQVAALDHMASQAIALAAVEGELLTFRSRLRMRHCCRQRKDQSGSGR